MKKQKLGDKIKVIAVPVTNIIVPLGIGILGATLTKKYVPNSNKLYKDVLQNVAVGAITTYVSTKVTEHMVEEVKEQCDSINQLVDSIDTVKEVMDNVKHR